MSGIRTGAWYRVFVLLFATLLCLSVAIPVRGQSGQLSADRQADLNQLIAKLADDDFQVREEAELRLLEFGADVIPHLEKFRHAGDNELRLRAVRIIGLIRRDRLDNLVRGFIAGDNTLPGWSTFSASIGTDDSARESYVELYKRRQSTLDRHDQEDLLVDLLKDLLQEYSDAGSRQATFDADLMACLSMQVIKSLPRISIAKDLPMIRKSLSRYFGQAAFVELASEKNQLSQLHRDAAICWLTIKDPDPFDLYRRINVAVRLSLTEGLQPAIQCLSLADPVPSGTIRDSMRLVAEYGDESHVELLSGYLNNSLVLHTSRVSNRGQTTVFTTQIGDMALTSMIHLTGQSYQDYGLNLAQALTGQTLPVSYAGFSADKDRQNARTKWTQWLATRHESGPQRERKK